ncbi:MAG: ornithine cyclodeaminase family protein [Chloroflexi bacterium]|nr:ornithine cyclodeaminase family protein [Chloroflexota bacterium]
MTLLLKEADVQKLLTMDVAIAAVEEAFRQRGLGNAGVRPRTRMAMANGSQSLMAGWVGGSANAYGLKVYDGPRAGGTARPTGMIVMLYDGATGQLLALVEGNHLGRMRTGAASGVATRYMANPDASTVGVIGAGNQAATQLEAVCLVRHIRYAWAYSRTPERREAFAQEMTRRLNIPVRAVESAEECVTNAEIVVTITNSATPVLEGKWLGDGCHVNAAGSNNPLHAEVDVETIRHAALIAADDVPQAQQECGELIAAAQQGAFRWERVVELADIVAGKVKGRPSYEAITLFESQGIGTEDVAAARAVYEAALKTGAGMEIPLG